MTVSTKLLVLALDAANPDLIARWADEGVLPNIARLRNEGLSARTKSVDGFYVGATWPSFYTSSDPSHHGIYWLDRLKVGTYWTQRCGPKDFGVRPALWEMLSRAGRRVIVLDVPLSRISPGLNGIQVVEWGVHDAAFGFRTQPRTLAREIARSVGRHPAPPRCDAQRGPDEYRKFAGQLAQGAAARAQLTKRLLETHPWDFAIQVFSETHCAGHQLWHYHDPTHPAFDAAVVRESGDLLRDVYVAVDRAIGSIASGLPRDVTLVVMALHGMSHTCGGSALLPEILERLDATYGSRDTSSAQPGHPRIDRAAAIGADRVGTALRRAYRLLPVAMRDRSYRWRSGIRRRLSGREALLCAEPAGKNAFVIGLGTGSAFSGIRLNLKGREPRGYLAPGENVERYCAWLETELMALTRPGSSAQIVRRVIPARELFDGPRLPMLPDLLVEWEPDPPMGTDACGSGRGGLWQAVSPTVGLVQKRNAYCRTGEHRADGFIVACGPSVTPGAVERTVSVLDLGPTFAAALGCRMESAGGHLIPEFLGDAASLTPVP